MDHPLLGNTTGKRNTLCCLPKCDWKIEHPVMQHAPGLGAIFGMPDQALEMTHHHQSLKRMEADIERHLKTHSVLEWTEAIMELRSTQLKVWNRAVTGMNDSDYVMALADITELTTPC